jgi:hypothetical protein
VDLDEQRRIDALPSRIPDTESAIGLTGRAAGTHKLR